MQTNANSIRRQSSNGFLVWQDTRSKSLCSRWNWR